LLPGNKTALFDALGAAKITVVVAFDGYGDSGQIENIDAKAVDEIVPLRASSHLEVLSTGCWGANASSASDPVSRLFRGHRRA
jgi:hypothetical protein